MLKIWSMMKSLSKKSWTKWDKLKYSQIICCSRGLFDFLIWSYQVPKFYPEWIATGNILINITWADIFCPHILWLAYSSCFWRVIIAVLLDSINQPNFFEFLLCAIILRVDWLEKKPCFSYAYSLRSRQYYYYCS